MNLDGDERRIEGRKKERKRRLIQCPSKVTQRPANSGIVGSLIGPHRKTEEVRTEECRGDSEKQRHKGNPDVALPEAEPFLMLPEDIPVS